eukprot:TRINITY_DN4944_c0_g1_i1.p1 TRINITY_DN4944_c0_g1~~TRINITY_DN4944_c0_g1_i1.p1  ORF type:complete len:219 (-),score=41.22 TRINITY_DN4944_c0_g1_i1:574-1230(-)
MNRRTTDPRHHPPPMSSAGSGIAGLRVVRKQRKDRRFSLTAVQHSRSQSPPPNSSPSSGISSPVASSASSNSGSNLPASIGSTARFVPNYENSPVQKLRKGFLPQDIVEGEWQEAVDPNTNQIYYYNSTTGETQWEVPPGYNRARKKISPSLDSRLPKSFDFSEPIHEEEQPEGGGGSSEQAEDEDSLEEMCADCGCLLVDEYLEINGVKYHYRLSPL